jgi:hypothetical protein
MSNNKKNIVVAISLGDLGRYTKIREIKARLDEIDTHKINGYTATMKRRVKKLEKELEKLYGGECCSDEPVRNQGPRELRIKVAAVQEPVRESILSDFTDIEQFIVRK